MPLQQSRQAPLIQKLHGVECGHVPSLGVEELVSQCNPRESQIRVYALVKRFSSNHIFDGFPAQSSSIDAAGLRLDKFAGILSDSDDVHPAIMRRRIAAGPKRFWCCYVAAQDLPKWAGHGTSLGVIVTDYPESDCIASSILEP
jgi:hypothetical protein